MKSPFYLPEELEYSLEGNTPQELMDLLENHALEHEIALFEYGAKDLTWAEGEGGSYLARIFEDLTERYFSLGLSDEQAKRVAKAFQPKFGRLLKCLPKDIEFLIDGKPVPANSLLFGLASPLFRDRLIKEGYELGKKTFTFLEVDRPTYTFLLEFIYSGKVEDLWKGTDEEIYSVMQLAASLQMHDLVAFSANLYKRYISRENVVQLMKQTEQEKLEPLLSECFAFLNKQQLGFEFTIQEGKISCMLTLFNERGEEFFVPYLPRIVSLICKDEALSDPQIVESLQKMTGLKALDLSHTHRITEGFFNQLQNLEKLILAGCSWLTEEFLVQVMKTSSSLSNLDLAENQQLNYEAWGALSNATALRRLNVRGCSVGDDEMDLIASSVPSIAELNISECTGIGNEGLLALSEQCQNLSSLHMSEIKRVTEEGAITAFGEMGSLNTLDLSGCSFVTEAVLGQLLRKHTSLKELKLKRIKFRPGAVDALKKKYPRLQIIC